MKGYKVFNPDWTCRGKQYTCPGKFEEEGKLEVCGHGMHFCKNAADCFNYYSFNSENKVAEVIAYGEVLTDDDKFCTDKLEIVREIAWDEVLRIVNTGKNCTGRCNTGDRNTGDSNGGHYNSGDYNSGHYNSGDWNKTCFSNGCFNTESPKICLFNKPSDWTYQDWLHSDARYILMNCPSNGLAWIWDDNMTDKEKTAHPEYQVTGGFLKHIEKETGRQTWWDNLTEDKKNTIKNIPNFDKDIFEEIMGIKVD